MTDEQIKIFENIMMLEWVCKNLMEATLVQVECYEGWCGGRSTAKGGKTIADSCLLAWWGSLLLNTAWKINFIHMIWKSKQNKQLIMIILPWSPFFFNYTHMYTLQDFSHTIVLAIQSDVGKRNLNFTIIFGHFWWFFKVELSEGSGPLLKILNKIWGEMNKSPVHQAIAAQWHHTS